LAADRAVILIYDNRAFNSYDKADFCRILFLKTHGLATAGGYIKDLLVLK
jgi:hypothetical protein